MYDRLGAIKYSPKAIKYTLKAIREKVPTFSGKSMHPLPVNHHLSGYSRSCVTPFIRTKGKERRGGS